MGSDAKITYSEIRTWKECRYKHHLGYQQRLTSLVPKTYFRLGDFVHRYIDAMYKEMRGSQSQHLPTVTLDDLMKRLEVEWTALSKQPNQFESEEDAKIDLAIIRGMVLGYHDHVFSKEQFEGVVTEREVQCEIGGVVFGGKIDGLVKMDGKYWTMEHKTASSFSETDRRLLFIDDQTTHYLVLANELFPDKQFIGSIRNILKKPSIKQTKKETLDEYCRRVVDDYRSRPEHYFVRILVTRTPEEIAAYREYMQTVTAEMARDVVFKAPSRDCGMCEFMEYCTEPVADIKANILMSQFRIRGQRHQELAPVFVSPNSSVNQTERSVVQ